MKTKRFLLLTLLFSAIPVFSFGQGYGPGGGNTTTIDGLKYILNEDSHTAMVANGNSWEGELLIPGQVTYDGETYTVDKIEWLAFNNCATLTKVRIPKTIVEIQHYAGYDACKNPFWGCTNLRSIEVDVDNEWMCSVDGVLFNKDKTWLYAYPAGAQRPSYHIPDGVTTIAGDAFAHNLSLQSVIMPNSVERTCFGTFDGCLNLESVTFSERLKALDAYTFNNCESLRVIDLPESVSKFAESVFRWTNLDALVVRGTLSNDLRSDTFYFVSKSMIIYAQPSEITKIKKVFSGTVLSLEDYTNTIHEIPATQVTSVKNMNGVFDLSGRRLSTPPAKGVYIEKGRKKFSMGKK